MLISYNVMAIQLSNSHPVQSAIIVHATEIPFPVIILFYKNIMHIFVSWTRSSCVVTLSRPPTSSPKITNRSFTHLWNQRSVSFRQPCINLLIMSHSLTHVPPAQHSNPPSCIHYFIPGSKLTFPTDLFHHSLLAHTKLPSRTILESCSFRSILQSNNFASMAFAMHMNTRNR